MLRKHSDLRKYHNVWIQNVLKNLFNENPCVNVLCTAVTDVMETFVRQDVIAEPWVSMDDKSVQALKTQDTEHVQVVM